MRFPILMVFALVLSAAPLRAETAPEDCNDANSTAQIVQCLATQTADWDRRLNTAYQKLLNTLPARRRDRLRSTQRLWVQFRDANCAYFASGEGTIGRIEAGQCMLRLTAARAQELESEADRRLYGIHIWPERPGRPPA
jgi:uncharacterized protein YecT (DUF1311 family)